MIRALTTTARLPALLALAALAVPAQAAKDAPGPLTLEASVVANDRPAAAREMDASRLPAETLALLDLKPGMDVADVMTGSGYWADIMAEVVGPNGRVVALEPQEFYADPRGRAPLDDLAGRNPNVAVTPYPFDALALPADSLDAGIIFLSYHDIYWQSEKYGIPRTDPGAFVAALYKALRPGGRLLVVDHAGAAGDTREIVDKLHRIDPAVVKGDFEAAGFTLDRRSDHLANREDDHTKLVFDPELRGKTDRFAYVFRKPG